MKSSTDSEPTGPANKDGGGGSSVRFLQDTWGSLVKCRRERVKERGCEMSCSLCFFGDV